VARAAGTALALAGVLGLAACGGGSGGSAPTRPADQVRAAADAYLGALSSRDWARACRSMTPRARRDLADAAGMSCARALAAGASSAEELQSARRAVPGAVVRVRGSAASIGPFGASQQPLRLQRVAGRWLVAS
jgi:hypothetical protein